MTKILTAIGLLVALTTTTNAQTNCATVVIDGIAVTQCQRPHRPIRTCATVVINGITYTQCE